MELFTLSPRAKNELMVEMAQLTSRLHSSNTEAAQVQIGKLMFEGYANKYQKEWPPLAGQEIEWAEAVASRVLDELSPLPQAARRGVEIARHEISGSRTPSELMVPQQERMHRAKSQPGISPKGIGAGCTVHVQPGVKTPRDSRKGDITLLQKLDGTLFESVNFPTAELYAGIGPRRREQLMKDGTLVVKGQGRNRRITVDSLLKYCPPKEDAK